MLGWDIRKERVGGDEKYRLRRVSFPELDAFLPYDVPVFTSDADAAQAVRSAAAEGDRLAMLAVEFLSNEEPEEAYCWGLIDLGIEDEANNPR